MSQRTAFVILIFTGSVLYAKAQNLTIYRSEKNVEETTTMIVKVINDQGLIFFETVNHDEIASDRGLNISPTRSILFEDPDLTTALIDCQQTAALDLPLEILVWEENDDVYIGFIDPKFMVKRFMIQGCDETIAELSRLMVSVTMDAMRQL